MPLYCRRERASSLKMKTDRCFSKSAQTITSGDMQALLDSSLGATGVYLENGLVCVVGAVIVAIFAVETRGRSLEEVSADVLEGADKYIK